MLRLVLLPPLLAMASCQLGTLADPSPFEARNQHPVQLTAVRLGARAPRAAAAGEVEGLLKLDWTNHWLRAGGGRDRIEMDGETVRFAPRLRVGLGRDMDLTVEVPFVHASGGALDRLIEFWHEIGGFPQSERDIFPRNRFQVRFERRQSFAFATAYELEPHGIRIGDVPIELAWFPLAQAGWHGGVRGAVELPTGDASDGYGNGKIDASLGAAGGWQAGPAAVFAWFGWAWAGTAARAEAAGVDYVEVGSGGIGGELALSDKFSAVLQVEWERSLLERLDDAHANRTQGFLWAGGRVRLTPRSELEFALGEDVVNGLSPDVTLHVALRLRL